jgi:Spy/CpxP family protein refolding chaperone
MKTSPTTKTLIIGAALLLTGAAAAFAHGGYWGGYGKHMMGYGMGPGMMGNGPGYGMGPGMMHGNNGQDNWANLTDEQRTQLDKAQEKFDGDTQGLREDIQDAHQALTLELNKATPDESKVTNLQKELTTLEGKFDQKRIQHQLEIRKILPESARRGLRRGYGGGYCRQ